VRVIKKEKDERDNGREHRKQKWRKVFLEGGR